MNKKDDQGLIIGSAMGVFCFFFFFGFCISPWGWGRTWHGLITGSIFTVAYLLACFLANKK